jgi:hypothetical protein
MALPHWRRFAYNLPCPSGVSAVPPLVKLSSSHAARDRRQPRVRTYCLYKDRGNHARARALTMRGASITLFCLLMAGFYFGIIPPTGLR